MDRGLSAADRAKLRQERGLSRAEATLRTELEMYKCEESRALERLKFNHTQRVSQFAAVTESGGGALRILTLINGAAAVSLLTFVGNLATRMQDTDAWLTALLTHAMLAFVFGVTSAAAGFAFRYLGQAAYGASLNDEATYLPRARRFRNISIISGVGAFIFFIVGMLLAYVAFAWSAGPHASPTALN